MAGKEKENTVSDSEERGFTGEKLGELTGISSRQIVLFLRWIKQLSQVAAQYWPAKSRTRTGRGERIHRDLV